MRPDVDVRSIPLPKALIQGLAQLMVRLQICDIHEVEDLFSSLFGGKTPTFGTIHQLEEEQLRVALNRAHLSPPVAAIMELGQLLPHVTPWTLYCPQCQELALTIAGGKINCADPGTNCPLCHEEQVRRVPMKLRVVAWTNGHLVDPTVLADTSTVPGESFPLHDEGIMRWCDNVVQRDLREALKDEGVPFYIFIAYMNLKRLALRSLLAVPSLLEQPQLFGLPDKGAVAKAVTEAWRFMQEREITNLPRSAPIIELARRERSLPSINIGERRFVIAGKIGEGDRSDVFRGYWDNPFTTEVVTIKLLASPEDADLYDRAASMLNHLHAIKGTTEASDFFSRLIPEIVTVGEARLPNGETRKAIITRYKNGFDWTLEDVFRVHPGGVDAQTMVWMWNRILMQLYWIHDNRVVHGGILPSHLLLHAMNHGVALLDWTSSAFLNGRDRIPCISTEYQDYYPQEILDGELPSKATDIMMSARCMIAVLGGDPRSGDLPRGVADPLARILRIHAGLEDGTFIDNALTLYETFGKIAESVHGPRRYHLFVMA